MKLNLSIVNGNIVYRSVVIKWDCLSEIVEVAYMVFEVSMVLDFIRRKAHQ